MAHASLPNIVWAIIVIGSMIPLGGCISTNTPGDLVLKTVQVVDWYHQPELPGAGASPLVGMLSRRDVAASGLSVQGGEKPHRLMLRVEFTSATNLFEFARENSYNIGNTVFFCEQKDASPHMSYPYVFWKGSLVGNLEPNVIRTSEGSLIPYYIFISISKDARPNDIPPQASFDLREDPEDVCFYLSGGDGSGGGYRSNAVKIPKNIIEDTLHRSE